MPHRLEPSSPPAREVSDNVLISHDKEVTPLGTLEQDEAEERPLRLRSIIVSPQEDDRERPTGSQAPLESPAENETLTEFQNKIKRRVRRVTRRPLLRTSPNILRGTSSKKRNISQMQNSPKGGNPTGKAASRAHKIARTANDEAGTSHTTQNPPIQLIPAVSKKKQDFRSGPHRVP